MRRLITRIDAASGGACATRFKKGFDDGQGQQLPGQRQEEVKGKGLHQARAKGSQEIVGRFWSAVTHRRNSRSKHFSWAGLT